jgi:phenylpropionate dioxygenase-like ring-hydroxylating dioxygenase large terminal subunit
MIRYAAEVSEADIWGNLKDRVVAHRGDRTTDFAEPYSVPASDYTSAVVHHQELSEVFRGGPIVAGLSGAADGPGGWFTLDVSGVSVIIVRGEDLCLRAFRNACPHRGMRLLSGFGTGMRRVTCPFHAWSFDDTGVNRGIPTRDAFTDYSEAELSLESVQVSESHGIIYISRGEQPIEAQLELGGVQQELDLLGAIDHVLVERQERSLSMNWKLGVDSYMEAYHLHYLHKASLRPFFYNDSSPFNSFGKNGRIGGVRRSIDEADWTKPDEFLQHITLEYQLFPNAVLIYQQDHFELSQVFPDPHNVGQSTVVQSVYAPRLGLTDERIKRFRKSFTLLLDVTVAEDFSACEVIQRNLESGSPQVLRLGRNEPGVAHFHRSLHATLGASAARKP